MLHTNLLGAGQFSNSDINICIIAGMVPIWIKTDKRWIYGAALPDSQSQDYSTSSDPGTLAPSISRLPADTPFKGNILFKCPEITDHKHYWRKAITAQPFSFPISTFANWRSKNRLFCPLSDGEENYFEAQIPTGCLFH